ncbi:MAG: hypothetical protein HYV02_05835 [Deltaproteobacteria bacterium]|nr:hypothetical protein [Deltaproteobacteria bacterium]
MKRREFVHTIRAAGAIAHRRKDVEFCRALINHNVVHTETLQTRLKLVKKLASAVRTSVATLIHGNWASH